jgi:cellulose synthase operon protein YhjQ
VTERNPLSDSNQTPLNPTPEDVASLYSWANLHGAKYRDFSASRAQMREKARQRMEQAIAEEKLKSNQEAETQQTYEAARAEEEKHRIEIAAQEAARTAAQEAVRKAAQEMAQEMERQAAFHAAQQAAQQAQAELAAQRALAAERAAREAARQQAEPRPAQMQESLHGEDISRGPGAPHPAAAPVPHAPMYEEHGAPAASTRPIAAALESANRPAWLTPERVDAGHAPTLPAAPEDTLQGSRERLASRWYALRSVFDSNALPAQPAQAQVAARAPVLAVFSLAGGAGKTSLAATLGRALSARGERVLLVDTAAFGLLPFFFGARDQRPGLLRTFSPPTTSSDAPIQMITLDAESFGSEPAAQEALTAEIAQHARGLSRVIVDLATASGAITRRILRLAPHVLVPLIPDMNSVVGVSSIDAFFEHNGAANGKAVLPYYILNQFDSSLPLHLDVREVLREQLGERLLHFTLRHTPAVSEALAEGMTVVDYAPNSAVVEDYASLAGWVKGLSAPASTSFRGVRWSER